MNRVKMAIIDFLSNWQICFEVSCADLKLKLKANWILYIFCYKQASHTTCVKKGTYVELSSKSGSPKAVLDHDGLISGSFGRAGSFFTSHRKAVLVQDDVRSGTVLQNWQSRGQLLPHRKIKYPVDFDGELKIGDVRYDDMT